MKGIILYQSKYGATEQYAKWLAEEMQFDCVKISEADISKVLAYDIVVAGGGIYASGIAGLSFLRGHMEVLQGKILAAFCVGASPYDEKAMQKLYSANFKDTLQDIPCFYCRGAWYESRMKFKDRMLCKMLQKAVLRKDPSTYEPWEDALVHAMGGDCDWTDKQNLAPMIAHLQAYVPAMS